MHPEISLLPSRVFYQGKLLDGPDMDVKTKQPWHLQEKFGPYKFFNVAGQEEAGRGHSLINRNESQIAVALYARLCKEFSNFDFDFRVGVISMYRAQIGELKRAFVQRFGQDIIGKILFHTVDGFQGQEKDVIILSCVRAGPGLQKIGFLAGKSEDYDYVPARSDVLSRYSANERCPYTCTILFVHPRERADFGEE
jgi:senataxin